MNKVNNRQFADTDKKFKAACEAAGVEPSKRQAAKWRQKRGKAWHERNAH